MNDNRTIRYEGRHALRLVTTVPRCWSCGRTSVLPGGRVGVRRTVDGVVGYAGLATCGRVWLCPVCNAKIMATRALEIGLTLEWVAAENLNVVWGSLTLRHDARSDLSQLFDITGEAWAGVVNARSWRGDAVTARVSHEHIESCADGCAKKYTTVDTGDDGRVGYIRATELNIGPNGWHPHFHPMLILRGSRADAEKIADDTVRNWRDAVWAAGGEAVLDGAQQLRVLDPDQAQLELAGYVTKATYDQSVALELVWSQGKIGRGRAKESTSHWALLAAIAQGLADEADRWEELEAATHGRRIITWSRGLRDFAGIGRERDDEELAAEEVGTRDDTVCYITADGWRRLRDEPTVQAQLLNVLEASGWAGLRVLLDTYGIEYDTVSAV